MEKNRGRGRPPTLTPEEREQRRIEGNKRRNEYHKVNRKLHPEKYDTHYEAKVRIRHEYKVEFDSLLAKEDMNIAQLVLTALEEKYGITLMSDIDRKRK